MRTEIEFNPSFTMLTAELSAGESIKAEPGAMAAQQGLEMRTIQTRTLSSLMDKLAPFLPSTKS